MLTHAFLGAVDINGVKPRSSKNQITVRVEQIFRTKSSVYVHYTMENNTKHSYHIGPPSAQQLQAEESLMFLQGLAHKQLDQRLLNRRSSRCARGERDRRYWSRRDDSRRRRHTEGLEFAGGCAIGFR
jgi:hypothetical protein